MNRRMVGAYVVLAACLGAATAMAAGTVLIYPRPESSTDTQ